MIEIIVSQFSQHCSVSHLRKPHGTYIAIVTMAKIASGQGSP